MQLRFLILIFLFTTISASAWEVPEDAQPLPDLKLDSGEAFVRGNSIYLRLRQLPANGKLNIPRLANVLERIQWVGDDSGATMTMWPEIHYWELRLHRKPPQPSAMVLELILDGPPVLFDRDPIAIPNRQGVLSLPAKFARTFGEKLRFEGQPHKNTVGYWTIAEDYATWQLQPATGEFDVEIYQGWAVSQQSHTTYRSALTSVYSAVIPDAFINHRVHGDPLRFTERAKSIELICFPNVLSALRQSGSPAQLPGNGRLC